MQGLSHVYQPPLTLRISFAARAPSWASSDQIADLREPPTFKRDRPTLKDC
jgi:hypothetical protein